MGNIEKTDKQFSGKRVIKYAFRYLVPLAFTVLLVWYMFSKVDFGQVMDQLRRGVNYWWILAAMGISVFSHIFRAMRWRLQLRGLGVTPPLRVLCVSIFGTYALNLVFPRLGEVWRCTYVAQREKTSFSAVLGSMVGDRLADTLTVLALTLFTFVIASGALTSFLTRYPVGQGMLETVYSLKFWMLTVGSVAALVAIFLIFRKTRVMQKITGMLKDLWQGFIVVARMQGRGRFLLLTFCIWTCYFLQLYLAFFAFSYTGALCTEPGLAFGLVPCLVAFVLSSIGMAVPSNGGLGPWNIAVMFGLAIYGINEVDGAAFSILVWSAQTVMLIILGVYTMIFISQDKGKANPGTPQANL